MPTNNWQTISINAILYERTGVKFTWWCTTVHNQIENIKYLTWKLYFFNRVLIWLLIVKVIDKIKNYLIHPYWHVLPRISPWNIFQLTTRQNWHWTTKSATGQVACALLTGLAHSYRLSRPRQNMLWMRFPICICKRCNDSWTSETMFQYSTISSVG